VSVILANKSIVADRRYDCLPEFDDRSRMFLSRAHIGPDAPIRTTTHRLPLWLDQGAEGACVGFGFSHELAADPVPVRGVTNEFARQMYKFFQTQDEWPGTAYEGTSVLAGAKCCQELGYISEYYWATSAREVAQALTALGPVVIGVTWREGMENVEASGYIHATGKIRGGHCVVLHGVKLENTGLGDNPKFSVLGRNSWGKSWGIDGGFWLSDKDLQALVDEGGAFCVPTARADSGRRPPKPRKKRFFFFL